MAVKKTGAAKPRGVLSKVEDSVMAIVSAIPLPHFKSWAYAYFHPAEAMEAGHNTWRNTLANLALMGVLRGIVEMIGAALSILVFIPLMAAADPAAKLGAVSPGVLLIVAAISGMVYPISALVFSVACFILAKLLGGSGKFAEQTLGIALVCGGAVLLTAIPSLIPCLGLIVCAILLIYTIYALVCLIRQIHAISTIRAVAVVLVAMIGTIPIFVLLTLIVLALGVKAGGY